MNLIFNLFFIKMEEKFKRFTNILKTGKTINKMIIFLIIPLETFMGIILNKMNGFPDLK
jgi:hypothetical protein